LPPHDTTGTLHDRLAALGGPLIVEAWSWPPAAACQPVKQPAEGVTYAHKIEKAEARVDWSQPAAVISRRIRAFDPFPGAFTELDGETFKLWRHEVLAAPEAQARLRARCCQPTVAASPWRAATAC
jgi:methionyl-tRNA formyltransferase